MCSIDTVLLKFTKKSRSAYFKLLITGSTDYLRTTMSSVAARFTSLLHRSGDAPDLYFCEGRIMLYIQEPCLKTNNKACSCLEKNVYNIDNISELHLLLFIAIFFKYIKILTSNLKLFTKLVSTMLFTCTIWFAIGFLSVIDDVVSAKK